VLGTRASSTAAMLQAILADETRHAASCAEAAARLVGADERDALAALQRRVAAIDRAFGVTLALRYWCVVVSRAASEAL
jgi:membrane protein required for beta-lactamase induction